MRNVRVLATDQRSRPSKDKDGNIAVRKYKLVTLETTPRMAEKISVALSIGTISLSLRSLADNQAELEQALASGKIKIPEGTTPEEEEKILAGLSKNPTASIGSYSSGDQVSRFQPALNSQTLPKNPLQAVAKSKQLSIQAEKIVKGPVVRVSRGGNVQEVQLDRR